MGKISHDFCFSFLFLIVAWLIQGCYGKKLAWFLLFSLVFEVIIKFQIISPVFVPLFFWCSDHSGSKRSFHPKMDVTDCSDKRGLQNFASLHNNLTSELWQILWNGSMERKSDALCEYAFQVGLRCPDNRTLGTMLCVAAFGFRKTCRSLHLVLAQSWARRQVQEILGCVMKRSMVAWYALMHA